MCLLDAHSASLTRNPRLMGTYFAARGRTTVLDHTEEFEGQEGPHAEQQRTPALTPARAPRQSARTPGPDTPTVSTSARLPDGDVAGRSSQIHERGIA